MKKISQIYLLFLLSLVLLVGACTKRSSLNTQAPTPEVTAAPVFTPKLSTISVPVSFRLHNLEDKLNQEFTGLLYQDQNLADDNMAVTVKKNGKLAMQAEGNKLYVSVPLHIYAQGRWVWQACKICPRLQKTEDSEFDVVVKSESLLSFTEDYQIKTVTTGDFEWGNTKPVISLGPLKIGLARFVEPALHEQITKLTAQLDTEIQKRINLKQYMQQAWLQLQKPILLDKNLDAWLVTTPTAIRVSPLMGGNGEMAMQIGLSAYLQAVTNGKPTIILNPTLPKLITNARLSDAIQIGLVSDISYAHATQLLKKQIVGQTYLFKGDKDQLTVKEAALSGSGDKLVLMLDVTGKTKAGLFTKQIAGKVFFKAIPYYDSVTASIKVRDLNYDVYTKDKIIQMVSWLAKNKFVENIQNQISFPVNTQLEAAKNMLQNTLDQSGQMQESVLLQGKITDMVPTAIYVTPTSIKAVITAKGYLRAQIYKL